MTGTLGRELKVVSGGTTVTLHWNETSLYVSHIGNGQLRSLCCELDLCSEKRVEVPLRQVVWAQASQASLEVSFLTRVRKKEFVLEKIEGLVDDGEGDTAIEWAEALVNAAYTGALLLFLYPR
jgi:sphingosine kinase